MAALRRIRTVFTGVAGTPWYSNLYFVQAGGSADAQIDMVRDFWTALAGSMDNGVTATVEGDCAVIESTSGAVVGIDSGTALTVVGGSASAALPPSNQLVLHEFTSLFVGGRQLRGKTFIPGQIITVADAAGAPTTTIKGTLLAAANAMVTASDSLGNWQVWSKTHLVASDIVSVSTPSKFGVLRTRRD